MPIWDDPRNKLNAGLLQPILPNQIGVPDRNQRLPFGEIQTPEREMKDVTPPDMPFFKDKNKMAMMLSVLSNGFGNMTLRGNGGLKQMNNALYAQAAQKDKENKTMQYLAGHNPDMYRILQKIPADQRGDYMKLAMQSKFKGLTGENSTADIRNFEYFNSLDPDQQKQFLGLKRGDKVVTGTDGSVRVIRADGSSYWHITPEDALTGTSRSADAEKGGVATGEDFRTLYKAARYTQDNLDGLQRTRDRLVNSKDGGGIFQPIEQFMNRVKAEFGSVEGAARATNEELLEMEGIERTMQWFLNSGLGARGLDTPAEFMQWLKLNGGDLSMTREASIEFIDRAMANTMRAADRYNAARTDPLYNNVDNIGSYPEVEYTNPFVATPAPNGGADAPPAGIAPEVWAEMDETQRALFR